MLALKPEVCVIGDCLAVFIGGSYKFMPLDTAEVFVRRMQDELTKLQLVVQAGD